MATPKLAALAVLAVILLHASTHAVAVRLSAFDETPAVMTINSEGEGGQPDCDGRYHSSNEMLAALSTGWYEGGRRCERMIRITSKQNGRTVDARVVVQCDTGAGCKDNVVVTSAAVWTALGLDTSVGEVPVTWSDA